MATGRRAHHPDRKGGRRHLCCGCRREITVDDQKAYTAPWTVKLNQHIVPDTELLDYVCLENEKDIQNLVGK